MSLAEKINIDVKNALKAGDKKLLSVSRSVLSELKNHLINQNLDRDLNKITKDSFLKVIKTLIKQKNETKEYLVKINDKEKINIIDFELKYLEAFMPKYLDDNKTEELINKYINDNKFEKNDFGKLMGLIKSKHQNEVNLSNASKIANKLLTK
ncbi:MAG: hypothetical protein CMI90_06060 [Pelagibacteraceae bacterium]|nr:hypothetical protein [Pelagibacteraceae bacterium]